MVGTAGFEPTAAGPPDRSATKLRHVPMRTPGEDRTRDFLVRSQALCPLSYGGMRTAGTSRTCYLRCIRAVPLPDGPRRHGGEGGIRTRGTHGCSALAGQRLQPDSSHLSMLLRGTDGTRATPVPGLHMPSTVELTTHNAVGRGRGQQG